MKKRYIIAFIITLIILFITNRFWIEFKAVHHTHIEFYIFTIIFVCGYLLSLKLTEYLADFKNLKNQSRAEIVFLALFFIMLFVPMSHIDFNTIKSEKENRVIAAYKPLFLPKNEINYNYGNDFNNWFNDRFYLRPVIVGFYNDLKYYIADRYYVTASGFLNKKNNWIVTFFELNKYQYSKETYTAIINNLKTLENYCEKNNIKVYILIAPRRNEIIKNELYPIKYNNNNEKVTKKYINKIKKEKKYKILYPIDILKKSQKGNKLYFKSDTHWTDEGAYLAYLELIKLIKADFPSVKISYADDFDYLYTNKVMVLPKEGFHNGLAYRSLGLNDENVLDTDYKYFVYKKLRTADIFEYAHIDREPRYNKYDYKYNNNTNLKLFLFGDSFDLNLMKFLSTSFDETKAIYTWVGENKDLPRFNLKKYEEGIQEIKPDVMVLCFSSIFRLQFLFYEEK